MAAIFINFSRLGFLSFLTFQALNLQGILDFKPNFSWEGLITTSLFVWLVAEIVSLYLRRVDLKYLNHYVFALAFIPTAIDALGDIWHFYDRFYWYDRIAHFVGAGSITLVSLFIFYGLKKQGRINWALSLILFISFALALMGGALYEVEEYLEDLWYWKRQVRLGDGEDTADDILFNALGGLFMITLFFIYQKYNARKIFKPS